MEFIPSILKERLRDTQKDLATFGMLPGVDLMQLDVMDGTFVARKSDFSAEEFLDVTSLTDLEVHLMVQYPQESLSDWLAHPNIVRIIIHAEVIDEHFAEILGKIKTANKTCGIALSPDTTLDVIDSYVDDIDVIMCMGVYPGAQGQTLIPATTARIEALRNTYPDVPLEVDGGVGIENIVALKEAGVTRVVLGSYLTEGESPEKQLVSIRSLIQ